MDAWPALAAGIGSAALGGFYPAFSLVVLPGLRHRPAAEASATMTAVNRAALRAPFLLLFFGTALLGTIVLGTGLATSPASPRVPGAAALLAGWALTMAVNVPLNGRLARSALAWPAYARPWTRANHARAALSVLGAVGQLVPLPRAAGSPRPAVRRAGSGAVPGPPTTVDPAPDGRRHDGGGAVTARDGVTSSVLG